MGPRFQGFSYQATSAISITAGWGLCYKRWHLLVTIEFIDYTRTALFPIDEGADCNKCDFQLRNIK